MFHRPKCNFEILKEIHKLRPFSVFHYVKWSILIANINKFLIQNTSRGRSSRLQMIFKIDVHQDFAILPGIDLCWCLFLITLQALSSATLLKRYCSTGVFLWWILQILKNNFFIEHLWWLLLKMSFWTPPQGFFI